MKLTGLSAATAIGLVSMTGAALADGQCGKVSIAEMNWASAELLANVDAIILKEGYGCDVELVPGATQTSFTSMSEKGQPDVAPEMWTNGIKEVLTKALAEDRVTLLVKGPITGIGEGWYVTPKFAADHPDLNTVEKLLAHPELIPSAEDPSKGAFMGCPAGWSCQLSNINMFRAYDMTGKGWVLVDPGSAAGMDGAIAKAVERDEPWFGYYWSPTAIIGKYHLVNLPFEAPWGGDENWEGCIGLAEQDCADPKPSSWSPAEVSTVVTRDFANSGSPALGYLSQRIFPGEAMNEMLVYMTDNQASGEDAAYEFLATREAIWSQWVPAEIVEKVKGAL